MSGQNQGWIFKSSALLVVAGAALLGGCNSGVEEQNVKLTEENSQLRAENSSLQQRVAAAEAKAAEASNRPANEFTPDRNWNSDRGTTRNPNTAPKPVVIEVAGDVLFAPGAVTISAAGKKELDKVAQTLKSKYSGHTFRVEGYTDTDPPNKIKERFPTNEALSLARAQAVENYLASKGISAGSIEAVGMGAAKPKATKAASRRVEIVVLGSR